MEGAACPVCAHTFPDKKQRKEHVFQHHSEPTVRFAGVSEATVVRRDAGGFLSCECGRTVKTVGALRRHAKKCSGANRVDAPRSGAFANVCAVHGCSRAFTSRNALAVHVYESHSSPKTRFMASDAVAVIPRDPVTRYLHCPCGQYSVLSTAVMLRHTKKCRGVPLAEAPPDPTPLSAAVPQTKILAKENRMELFTTSRTPEVRNEPESVQLQQQRTPYELQVQHLLDPPSQSPQDVMSADQFLYELLSDPEQRRLMREMCIVVDENDRAIGADTKKNCHLLSNIYKGLLHRSCSILIFNNEGKLLLQQRADEKITFPGYWSNSCCGPPLAREDEIEEANHMGARRAAQRILEHELGIKAHQMPLEKLHFLTRIHYVCASDGIWGEHEVDYIFAAQADVDIYPSTNEVKVMRYVTRAELGEFFDSADQNKIKITPWFRLMGDHLLDKWWNNLDKLPSLTEPNTIHRMCGMERPRVVLPQLQAICVGNIELSPAFPNIQSSAIQPYVRDPPRPADRSPHITSLFSPPMYPQTSSQHIMSLISPALHPQGVSPENFTRLLNSPLLRPHESAPPLPSQLSPQMYPQPQDSLQHSMSADQFLYELLNDPEQRRLMREMCIIVDENDRAIGADTKKNCHLMANINKGLLHRALSVFLFNSEGKLLLQQRAEEKITFPGFWGNTCCGQPLAREDEVEEENQMGARRAAQRILDHELGVKAEHVPLENLHFLTKIQYLAASDGVWGEHEVDYIFIMQADVDVHPSPNEVKAMRYVTKQELRDLLALADQNVLQVTPWFRLIVDNFLFKWWDNLNNLKSCVEPDVIHRFL